MHLVCGNQPIIDQWQAAVETRNILARSQVPRLSEVGHVHMGSRSGEIIPRFTVEPNDMSFMDVPICGGEQIR